MKIRAFRKLLESIEEMQDAIVSPYAHEDQFQSVLTSLAKDKERREQFRLALLLAIKSANSLDQTEL
jgi:hypothetical protein